MTAPASVAVIGLGLMGGSLARDLAARQVRVAAYDSRTAVLETARNEGILEKSLDSTLAGIDNFEMVVLATPVDVSIELLGTLKQRIGPETIVTDLGSTKEAIANRAAELGYGTAFVGSHPLTGDHRTGWASSRKDLYRGATIFICPTESTESFALTRVCDLWTGLGARYTVQPPAEHDRRMASISHLPQVLSTAFATVAAEGGFEPADLGPGGRDVARLAGSSPEMWAAIAKTNSANLAEAVEGFRDQLDTLVAALRSGDDSGLLEFFRRGGRWAS